jgi:hypothetical protein
MIKNNLKVVVANKLKRKSKMMRWNKTQNHKGKVPIGINLSKNWVNLNRIQMRMIIWKKIWKWRMLSKRLWIWI